MTSQHTTCHLSISFQKIEGANDQPHVLYKKKRKENKAQSHEPGI
jgi:hypothetical protein